MSQSGYFLPMEAVFPIRVVFDEKASLLYKKKNLAFLNTQDEHCTIKMFVTALANFHHDDAKAYISKNYTKDFDLEELSVFFAEMVNYKNLIKIEFDKKPKNCKTSSILVMDRDSEIDSIIHLHMIKEPDSYSNWKIYGIDKE